VSTLFLTVLNMSLTGAFVITVICLVRQLFKKAPKVISYALWAVVGFRLVFPFSIEIVFSLMPFNSAPIPTAIVMQPVPHIDSGIPFVNAGVNSVFPVTTPYYSVSPLQIWITIGAWIWLLGVAALVIYGVVSFIVLKRKMQKSVWKALNIYEADNIKSPFVLGIISPKIFLPIGLSGCEQRYILLHEQTHIRRYDHVIKFLAYFILCLHWFNPLVWLAFWLMGADMEMSCDERVMHELGNDIGADYSLLLVRLATGKQMINSSPLAFGEGGIKERVKRIMNFKKSSRLVIVIAITLASVISVGFAMNRTAAASEDNTTAQGTITGNTHMTISGFGGSIHSTFRDGNFVTVAGTEGAVIIFYDIDGVWFIPPGEVIHIDNGEPFCFDNWLYETWGVAAVDVEPDYLLEKAFLTRNISDFNIMMHLGNPSTEKILEIFSTAAELSETTFFALTQNHAIPRMTADEIDAIGNAAFERHDTAIFSMISQHMSTSNIIDIFIQSAVESNTSFFALTQNHAIPRMTADEIDAIGNAAFERQDTAIFSMILQHISINQRGLLLERAIKENQITFVALLGGEWEQIEPEFPWGIFFGSDTSRP